MPRTENVETSVPNDAVTGVGPSVVNDARTGAETGVGPGVVNDPVTRVETSVGTSLANAVATSVGTGVGTGVANAVATSVETGAGTGVATSAADESCGPLVVLSSDPPDEAAELNELVHALLHALRRDAVQHFGPTATTPGQHRLLRALQRAGGPRRLGELAQVLDVAPRSITAKVDQAEADGQVRRVPDPADRRATLVELTPAGSDVLARVSAERSAIAADRLARLSPDERSELLRLLRAVATPPA
jgi:DNA-binding MarR family transcriptional regulator